MDIKVKIHTLRTEGGRLADASVSLDGCFAIRGVRIVSGSKGPFVAMPSYKSGDQYRDVCFPCTKEFRQQFQDTVLCAYHRELAQIHRSRGCERPRQRESSGFEERAWPR